MVFYSEPPRVDADGTQTLAKMTRYRQGVVVSFRAAGAVYAFSWQYFINEVLAGYLFLAIAVFVADLVAFNLLPNGVSTVLRAKRAEKVSPGPSPNPTLALTLTLALSLTLSLPPTLTITLTQATPTL